MEPAIISRCFFVGLDNNIDDSANPSLDAAGKKKVPYSKPIPKNFQARYLPPLIPRCY